MGKLAILVVLLAGCDLYFDHGGGDDICLATPTTGTLPAEQLRDPSTGACQTFGQNPCDGVCGPCNYGAAGGELLPNWPVCSGMCELLDEASCLTTPGCRAAFADGAGAQPWQAFLGCWETETGGSDAGACPGLDADTCAQHDNCSPIYTQIQDASGVTSLSFARCIAEPSSPDLCAAVDCGPSSQCEVECTVCDPAGGSTCTPFCQAMCVPDPTCKPDSCGPGYTCVQQCDALATGLVGACTISCEPTTACPALATELACKGRPDCEPVYVGTNCTCYPDHCECSTETYERCQPLQ